MVLPPKVFHLRLRNFTRYLASMDLRKILEQLHEEHRRISEVIVVLERLAKAKQRRQEGMKGVKLGND